MAGRWFANFGTDTATILHGSERVITPAQAPRVIADVTVIRLTDDVKRAIEDAVRRAMNRRRGGGDV